MELMFHAYSVTGILDLTKIRGILKPRYGVNMRVLGAKIWGQYKGSWFKGYGKI